MSDFNLDKYYKSLKTDHMGRRLIYLEKTDSTNNYAYELIRKRKENPDGSLKETVVLAETQKKGRGRLEREWISSSGGLWFSIILETNLDPRDLVEVTLIAAYSIVNILDIDYGINTAIKWPNDIYHKKLKLGGILTEAEKTADTTYLVTGIGLNVNVTKEDLAPYSTKATSIKIILGRDIERETLLAKILFDFEKDYEYYSNTKDFKTVFKKIEKKLKFG
jgi:BirA family biotin operon repressor/biotin-[acetyl-CoA-carboxylase] ligase